MGCVTTGQMMVTAAAYRLDNMASPEPAGNMIYRWKALALGRPKGWRVSSQEQTMTKLDSDGSRI